MYRALVAFLLAIVVGTAGYAQNVRTNLSNSSAAHRAFQRAAQEKERADWPLKQTGRGRHGTQVRLTFDLWNADVTLVTDKSYGQEPLLETARKLTVALGYLKADFIHKPGELASSVDIELNDYLVHPQKNATTFSFDLARLVEALKATDLPKPIVIAVRPEHSSLNRVTLGTTELLDTRFFGLDDVKPESKLHWSAELHWSGGFLIGLLTVLYLLVLAVPWLPWKKAQPQAKVPNADPSKAKEIEFMQLGYAMLFSTFAPAIALILVCTVGTPQAAESAGYLAWWDDRFPKYMAEFPLLILASFGGAHLYKRSRLRKQQS